MLSKLILGAVFVAICDGAVALCKVARHVDGSTLLQIAARDQTAQGVNATRRGSDGRSDWAGANGKQQSSDSLWTLFSSLPPETHNPSHMAYGWTADSRYPSLVTEGTKLFYEHNESIQRLVSARTHSRIFETEAALEFGAEIATDNGIEGKLDINQLPFPAAAEANINAMGSFEFKQFRYDMVTKAQFASLTSKKLHRHEELLPEVKQMLLNSPLETIHRKLGDFYATKIEVGGVFQLTVVTNAIEVAGGLGMQVGSEIDAQVASGSVGIGASVESTVGAQAARTRLTVLGGDSKVWLKVNHNNPVSEVQKEWAETISEANEQPIAFNLVPIWNLLNHDDMNRKKAIDLKNYMITKWYKANQQLPKYEEPPNPEDTCKDNENIPGSDFWPFPCWFANMNKGQRRRRNHCQCDTGYQPDGPLRCSRCKDQR